MKSAVIAIGLTLSIASTTDATDRFFSDVNAYSTSGKYRVDASSPDNQGTGFKSFQSQFTYRCINTENGETVWVRKQPMGKPLALGEDSAVTIANPEEASPVAIYVSDTGFTAIRTAWDELILVALSGQVTGKISLLEEGLTKEENAKYVQHTTAGPLWSGLSAWYFTTTANGECFVVRPWWGRRLFVSLETGKLRSPDDELISDAMAMEGNLALAALDANDKTVGNRLSTMTAAYLAGVLKLEKAIPSLQRLEKSEYIGSSTLGGLSLSNGLRSGVDPQSYSTFTHRQVAQLSLRRLGVSPKSLPCHSFEVTKDGVSTPFIIPELKRRRAEAASELKAGMPATDVLNLIGSPDYISRDSWSYDVDSEKAYSLILKFDGQRVAAIHRDAPLWTSGNERDRELAY